MSNIESSLNRILAERLEQFDVPGQIIDELRSEILAFFQRPEKRPHGACVFTPEASMASDVARQNKQTQVGGAKPENI